jgi:hypothetical protein
VRGLLDVGCATGLGVELDGGLAGVVGAVVGSVSGLAGWAGLWCFPSMSGAGRSISGDGSRLIGTVGACD